MPKPLLTIHRLRRWAVAGVVLAVTWSAVGVVVQGARAKTTRPVNVVKASDSVIATSDEVAPQVERVNSLVRKFQSLSPKDKMRPEVQDALQRSYAAMSPDQQMEFVESVLPMGLEQMVAAYRDMGEDQKRLVTEKLYAQFNSRGWLPEDTDAEAFARLLDENADQFLDAPDAATRLELLPEMQRVLHIMQAR